MDILDHLGFGTLQGLHGQAGDLASRLSFRASSRSLVKMILLMMPLDLAL